MQGIIRNTYIMALFVSDLKKKLILKLNFVFVVNFFQKNIPKSHFVYFYFF